MLIFLICAVFSSSSEEHGSSSDLVLDSEELHNDYVIEYKDENDIEMVKEIGHGRFSNVFHAKINGEDVAAKRLKPVESWRIKREIRFMEMLRDEPNVVKLHGVYGDELGPVIVTELAKTDSNTIISYGDLQWTMKEILRALNGTHYHHVFHRDIKWQNMLVSFQERKLRIIDWGLAEYVIQGHEYTPCVGTKSYKSPELLLEYRNYGTGVDIWAAGVVFANLMFGCPSFFAGADNAAVLARHVRLFGTRRMMKLARGLGYKKSLTHASGQSFLEYALPHTRHLITRPSLDLLQKMLTPEPDYRISAADALDHPFFTS